MKTPSSKISYMARIILKKSHYLQKNTEKIWKFQKFYRSLQHHRL